MSVSRTLQKCSFGRSSRASRSTAQARSSPCQARRSRLRARDVDHVRPQRFHRHRGGESVDEAALLAEEAIITANGELVREARDTLALMFNRVPVTLNASPSLAQDADSSVRAGSCSCNGKGGRDPQGTRDEQQEAEGLITGDVTGVSITLSRPPRPGACHPAPHDSGTGNPGDEQWDARGGARDAVAFVAA